MSLFLYGGGDDRDNKWIDLELIQKTQKKSPQISYIPYSSYDSDYNEFVERFSRLGVKKILHAPIDNKISEVLEKRILESDIIYLDGGNTFYFLKILQTSAWSKKLKSFYQKGGVLAGLSAGGILLTPNIQTASFPEFDRDENDENLKDLSSLGLCDFEFFPHYKNSKRYDVELKNHSKKIKKTLYAVKDGSAICVDTNEISFYGDVYEFKRGSKLRL